ncbi:MAG: hypothetical protein WBB27_02700 [Maribacter sp.]
MKFWLRISVISIVITLTNFCAAQKSSTGTIDLKYKEHFQHVRESVHLHLNKNTFFIGEEIWWAAYVYNKKLGKPSSETMNLYVGLYNSDGKQIRRELFLAENGMTNGSFNLDSDLKSGTYFVKAGTKWMKNFNEDVDFLKEINIVNIPTDTNSNITTMYDLQVFPEGGHLLANVNNTVGFYASDEYGKGLKITKGFLYKNDEEQVTTLYNNEYGMGKVSFLYNRDNTYTIKAFLENGEVLEKEIPRPEDNGIAININNIIEDKLLIVLKTNEATLPYIKGKEFHLAVHRDGLMTLKTLSINETERTITIAKDKLLTGTNIVTLFDQELNPIAERLLFNYNNLNLGKLLLDKPVVRSKDSLSIKINAFSKDNTSFSLSLSALPAETLAGNFNNNIISDFLLKPYLKSSIENPSRYFTEIDRIKEYELDLVLLNQGWSRYDWNSIFDGAQEIKHPFESGISVSGSIKSRIKKGEELAINQGDFFEMLFLDVQDSTNFRITDFQKRNGDTLRLTLQGKNKKLRKPDIEIDFLSDLLFKDSILKKEMKNIGFDFIDRESKTGTQENNEALFENDRTIVLDEAIVTEDKPEKKLTRKSPLVNSSFTGFKITEKEIRRNIFLTDFIAKNGFRVFISPITGMVFIANTRPASGPVKIYENDIEVVDRTQLLYVPMEQIDEIYMERNGAAGDFDASGGVIRIYRKEGATFRPSSSSFAEKLVENSFTRPKEFYRPKYLSFENENFLNYGVIHWEPKLKTNKMGEAIITIPNNGLKSFRLFI